MPLLKYFLLIVSIAWLNACASYPPSEKDAQSNVEVYGVIDVGVGSSRIH